MFVVETLVDVIRIPPNLLLGGTGADAGAVSSPSPTTANKTDSTDEEPLRSNRHPQQQQQPAAILKALHSEIDLKYPNRVLLDHGLVISRYGGLERVSHGVCVSGDGGSHHECRFRLLLFRPLVGEVCLGRIRRSTSEGIHVTLGFFEDVFIPAYWMLRPSTFDPQSGLWVWTPQYDDDDGECNGNGDTERKVETSGEGDDSGPAAEGAKADNVEEEDEAGNRYEMEVGSEIRFKVKSIHFTRVTKTAKGLQSTTTTTTTTASTTATAGTSGNTNSSPPSGPLSGGSAPIRRERSSTMDSATSWSGGSPLTAAAGTGHHHQNSMPPMYIVASICEDGLGLTSWWTNAEEEEEDDEEEEKAEADADADELPEG